MNTFGLDKISEFIEEDRFEIVVDSYVWIELFRGSEKGKKVAQPIIESDLVFSLRHRSGRNCKKVHQRRV